MTQLKRLNGKGQVWTMDFVIGIMLFIVILLITVKVVFSMYPHQDHIIVYRDAVHLSDALLSQGYPLNWTTTTVLLPGVAENNRIDNIKLLSLSNMDYYKIKTLMHITSDYIFFMRNSTDIINTGKCVYGYNISTNAKCEPLLGTIHYDTLARVDRMVIYNSTVIIMTVYTWH